MNPTRGHFPACPGFDTGVRAWTGLWVKFNKQEGVCLSLLGIERAVWVYRTPG